MEKKLIAAYLGMGELPDEKSMHLAIKKDGEWKKLNFGNGLLYAKADFEGKIAGYTRVMSSVGLYRRENGLIGITAKTYSIERVNDGEWKDADNKNEKMEFFQTRGFDKFFSITEDNGCKTEIAEIIVDNKVFTASILEVNAWEADYIEKKHSIVENVGVEEVCMYVPLNESINELPPMKAIYSDGSKAEIPIEWNYEELAKVDFSKEGTYYVSGKSVVKEYKKPMVEGIADPMVILYEGNYYLIGTNEFTLGRDLYIRKSDTIEGLSEAEKHIVFKATESGDHSGCNWAPELHVINGKLCCLFASSENGEWNHVQSRIMVCEGDPCDIESWLEPVYVCKKDGERLIKDGITLDMTYFEANGSGYYAWAQRAINNAGVDSSDIYIAKMDKENPDRLLTDPVCIAKPDYAWDRQHTEVVEGPNVLKANGKLYMTISGDSVSNYYCMGMLVADENADLLDEKSWVKMPYPVLDRTSAEGEWGPGHNAFTKDEFGRDVLIYHAKLNGGMRSAFARTIHYAFDGTPLFYLEGERFLKLEYREVKAKVVVEKPAFLFVHFKEKTTPDGEQVYFGLSKDGFHWEEVNDGYPVLWTYYGDMGVRDFTITKCEKTGKYYIFATDLSLSYGMRGKYHHSWAEIGRHGSHYLSVWESGDLVNWTEQRLVKFGGDEFGCRWAPDILHDKENDDYIIHWSSPHKCDNYSEKAIYYSRTKDFKNFTEPELLYRKEDSGVIDSAMYEENGKYYLFVKSEKNPCGVILLESEHATGPFEKVEGFFESINLTNPAAYEAPTAVKSADGKWCLFLDYFGVRGKGQGYVPFVADKLEGGKFVRSDASFSFPYGYKHGTIIKITETEYNRIKEFDWSEPADNR